MATLSAILIVIAEKFHIATPTWTLVVEQCRSILPKRINSSPKAPTVGALCECKHLQDLGTNKSEK